MMNFDRFSIEALSDIHGKLYEAFWKNFPENAEVKNVEVPLFVIFLLLLIFSNLFAYMIRIFYNSRPVLDVNIASVIKLYLVEIMNATVTIVSVPSLWVCLISYLPFSVSYVLGLLTTLTGYIAGGLASAVGIIKILIVLQVSLTILLKITQSSSREHKERMFVLKKYIFVIMKEFICRSTIKISFFC